MKGDGYVYLIQSGEGGPVKIGFSLRPERRLLSMQPSNPCELILVAKFRGTRNDERDLHERFKHLRMRGEWFRLPRDIVNAIKAGRPKTCFKWLEDLRLLKSFLGTWSAVANCVGVSPGTMRNWRIGIHTPSGPMRTKIRLLSKERADDSA